MPLWKNVKQNSSVYSELWEQSFYQATAKCLVNLWKETWQLWNITV